MSVINTNIIINLLRLRNIVNGHMGIVQNRPKLVVNILKFTMQKTFLLTGLRTSYYIFDINNRLVTL